jgi:hypothetical protein
MLLTDKIEQKGRFSYAPKSFDADDPGTPVYLMVEFPDDFTLAGIDQKFVRIEKIFHFQL